MQNMIEFASPGKMMPHLDVIIKLKDPEAGTIKDFDEMCT